MRKTFVDGRHWLTGAGLCCLALSLLLLPMGVDVVRAEDDASVVAEPATEAATHPGPAAASPTSAEVAARPSEDENREASQPEFIQLNTRGYNYGPRPGEAGSR